MSAYIKRVRERAVAKKTLNALGRNSLPKKGTTKRKDRILTYSKKRVRRLFKSKVIISAKRGCLL